MPQMSPTVVLVKLDDVVSLYKSDEGGDLRYPSIWFHSALSTAVDKLRLSVNGV